MVSVAAMVAAVWAALWAMSSSSSLACVECNCSYALFADNWRCRQPALASILAIISLGVAVLALVLGFRRRVMCPGPNPTIWTSPSVQAADMRDR